MPGNSVSQGWAIWRLLKGYAATSLLGRFSLWSLRSWDRSVHPIRSLVISVLGHLGPKDRTEIATSVLRKPKLYHSVFVKYLYITCLSLSQKERKVQGFNVQFKNWLNQLSLSHESKKDEKKKRNIKWAIKSGNGHQISENVLNRQ